MSKREIILSLALAVLVVALFALLQRAPQISDTQVSTVSSINIKDVESSINNFLANITADNKDIVGVLCDTDGTSCQQEEKADTIQSRIASLTWGLNYFSSVSKSAANEDEKSLAINKAKKLATNYYSKQANIWTSQSFVFAEAYDSTRDLEFLKAFFYSAYPLFRDSINGKIFEENAISDELPMTLVRYAEAIVKVQKYLDEIPFNELQSIKYPSQLAQDNYKKFIDSSTNLKSKTLAAADRLLEISLSLSRQNVNFSPLRSQAPTGFNQNICWTIMGNLKVGELTGNPEYTKLALQLINEADLSSGKIKDIDITFVQNILPCLESYRLLEKKNLIASKAIENLISDIVHFYWDGSKNKICSENGALLNRSNTLRLQPSLYRVNICKSNGYDLSDNSWFYSILKSIKPINPLLQSPYAEGGE